MTCPVQVNPSGIHSGHGREFASLCWKIFVTLFLQRGATLAPKIQVFNAIACRALQDSSPLSVAQSGASSQMLMDCPDSEVAARAASIQAGEFSPCISPNSYYYQRFSCDDDRERSKRSDDGLLE